MRVLGVDFGQRRIGLALSDASATLARPWKTVLAAGTPMASAGVVASVLADWRTSEAADGHDADQGDALTLIVVGVPKRLNGEDTDQTRPAQAFAAALGAATGMRVEQQDERLTSHEANERLAVRERDWRRRKEKLDAASAAIILQDYLDQRRGSGA